MSKWYEVIVSNTRSIVVQVVDDWEEDDACEIVLDNMSNIGDTDVVKVNLAKNEDEVESMKRHADEVLEL